MDRCCCEPAPDRSGRECNKPLGHDGDHWTYGGNEKTWPQDRTAYLEKQIDRLLVDIANLRDDAARWRTLHDDIKADLDKTRLAWAVAADERDLGAQPVQRVVIVFQQSCGTVLATLTTEDNR